MVLEFKIVCFPFFCFLIWIFHKSPIFLGMCCDTPNCNAVTAVTTLATTTAAQGLKCYLGSSLTPTMSVSLECPGSQYCSRFLKTRKKIFTNPDYSFARYDYVCTSNDSGCELAKIGDTVTAYVCGSTDICDAFKVAGSPYKNGMCCGTDNCNDPRSVPPSKTDAPAGVGLKCWQYSTANPSMKFSLACPVDSKCARYDYVCAMDDTSCTAEQVGKTFTAFTCGGKDLCDAVKVANSAYKNGTND
jgi:hypothetical protein